MDNGKGRFIADQEIELLRIPQDEGHRGRLFLQHFGQDPDAYHADRELKSRRKTLWPRVAGRVEFLADLAHRRLCITSNGGTGKSSCLAQLAYAREQRNPGHLVVHLELSELMRNGGYQASNFLGFPLGSADGSAFLHQSNQPIILKKVCDRLSAPESNESTRIHIDPDLIVQVQAWLFSLARLSQLTVVVDSIDQLNRDDAIICCAELRTFLEMNPLVHCVIAGRPYAITRVWDALIQDQVAVANPNSTTGEQKRRPSQKSAALSSSEIAGSGDWQFAAINPFTPTQVTRYLGNRWSEIKHLQADAIFNPRTLNIIRKLSPIELARIHSASGIYWTSLHKTLEEDLAPAIAAQNLEIRTDDMVATLAAVAFEMLRHDDSPVTEIREDQIDEFLSQLDERYIVPRFMQRRELTFEKVLEQIAQLNTDSLSLEAYSEENGIRIIRWSDATIRDFFAALWPARFMNSTCNNPDDDILEWLAQHVPARQPDNNGDDYWTFWKLLCEMPAHEKATEEESFVSAVRTLYSDHRRPRPSELVYRSWPTLIGLSRLGNLPPDWTELDLAQASRAAQKKARQYCPIPVTVGPHSEEDYAACAKSGALELGEIPKPSECATATQLIIAFLTEFPKICAEDSSSVRRPIARAFNGGFQPVPINDDDCKETWFSSELLQDIPSTTHDKRRSIPRRFQFHTFPLTNEVYELFDESHAGQFADYASYSRHPDCPVVFLSWFDAACASLWFHGQLPSELEWEYACRADPGGAKGRIDFWWSKSGESFMSAESRAKIHACVLVSHGGRTRPVGAEHSFNDFGLSDTIGNVWEWTASYFHDDSIVSALGEKPSLMRSLRGGCFMSINANARCGVRLRSMPDYGDREFGVRIARPLD